MVKKRSAPGRKKNRRTAQPRSLEFRIFVLAMLVIGCGKALEIPVANRSQDQEAIEQAQQFEQETGTLVPVTLVVPAASMTVPGGNEPFSGDQCNLGDTTCINKWVPAHFPFTYPTENFTLGNTALILDTKRDDSDTEAIIFGGKFSGAYKGVVSGVPPENIRKTGTCTAASGSTGHFSRPGMSGPFGGVAPACRATSSLIDEDYSRTSINYSQMGGTGANPVFNPYYIQYSLDNYMQDQVNTFELDAQELLRPAPGVASVKSVESVLEQGDPFVVLGDDSPMITGAMVINGTTFSRDPLTCDAPVWRDFRNVLVHKDGNSVAPALTLNLGAPGQTTLSALGTYQGVHFHFNPQLPKVGSANVEVQESWVRLNLRRTSTAASAIVINGVGIKQAGFVGDINPAVVDYWVTDPAVIQKWTDIVNAITVVGTAFAGSESLTTITTATTINLYTGATPKDALPSGVTLNSGLFTEAEMRTILAEGKLSITLAGGIVAAQAKSTYSTSGPPIPTPGSTPAPETVNRTYRMAVQGPTFWMSGRYKTQNCAVPPVPPPLDTGDSTIPVVANKIATAITSNSISIGWTVARAATAEVWYGIGEATQLAGTVPANPTFPHGGSMTINGLQPYRYYTIRIKATDEDGNSFTSAPIRVGDPATGPLLRTLR